MNASLTLGRRAIRESLRTPDALIATLFIPLFFLVVNVGQAARIFPSGDTGFLRGQNYAAFQLPVSLLLAGRLGQPPCIWSRRSKAATSTNSAPLPSRECRS